MSKSLKNTLENLARNPEDIRSTVRSASSNVVVKQVLTDKEPFYRYISHTPAKIVSWREARGASKVQLAIEAMVRKREHAILAITINLSPSLAKTLRKPISLNYIRDQFREAIKRVLKSEQIYLILVKEEAGANRTHFHGALLIPKWLESKSLISELEKSIASSCPCRKYVNRFGNKTVRIDTSYKYKTDPPGTKRPIDSGWGTYITKNHKNGRNHVMTTEVSRLGSEFTESIRKHVWIKLE